MTTATRHTETSQADRYKQAARDLECDEPEVRWNPMLKTVAKQKPAPDPEKPE